MDFRIAVVVTALAAVAAGIWFGLAMRAPVDGAQETGALVLHQPRDPGPFRLVDHRGGAFTPAALEGRWTLWFFGFTHCPDVCPMTLAALNQVDRALADAGKPRPDVLMVSVDPARDTPEKLADYVPHFNEGFTGVTGDAGEIRKLTERLGIIVRYVALDGDDYTVDHGTSLLLVGPDGLVRAIFQSPHEPRGLIADLPVLMGSSPSGSSPNHLQGRQ